MPDLLNIFSALSDATRLSVIEKLMTDGELPAGALVETAQMTGPAMSRHLKVLRNAGLITQRIDGTRRLYSVKPEALKTISNWTLDHRAFWQAGMDRLESMLAQEGKS